LPELVLVEWGDAHGGGGWKSREDLQHVHNPLVVVSTGFVVKKDNVGITLASGWSEEYDGAVGCSFIPAGMIRKITKVKV
jgi:hypothetical protein